MFISTNLCIDLHTKTDVFVFFCRSTFSKFTLHIKTISVKACNFIPFLLFNFFLLPPSKSNDRHLSSLYTCYQLMCRKCCIHNSFNAELEQWYNVFHQTAVKVLSECLLDYSSFKNIICLFLYHFPYI